MRQAQSMLPVYTGDVSGVCSALFELGGMVVIHDPSGCNSTYNTHDEIRWYDQDSLIFISGLTDVDAIMGNDEKLVHDVVEAARQTHPRFVVLVSSPVPYQLGTDFGALARLVEDRSGVPCLFLPTNGMHDYVRGAGRAFELLAHHVDERRGSSARGGVRVNVLGLTPLDFAAATTCSSLEGWLEGEGCELVSCWAMGDTLDDVHRAAEADVNLVVSATGLRAARVLERRLGIPFVAGVPVGAFADGLAQALRAAALDGRSRLAYQDVRRSHAATVPASVTLVGEPVSLGSVAAALERAGTPCRLVSPLEDTDQLIDARCDDVCARGEERVMSALAGAEVVVGDPFYALACTWGTRFCRLPHLAFSGRQWLHEIPDLVRLDPSSMVRAASVVEGETAHE